MPRYEYYCEQCDSLQTIAHSWQEKIEECPECGSNLFSRVMSMANLLKKNNVKQNAATGTIVNRSIEDAKKELELEKKKLKDRKK